MKMKATIQIKKTTKNSLIMLFAVLTAIASVKCGGGGGIAPNIYFPDLDPAQYNDPNYVEGWNNLKNGKTREASKYFEKSILDEEKLLVGYGYTYLAQNKLGMAKTNFERCLSINPENMQAQFGLANIYELLKENDRAFSVYSKLRAAYQGNTWVKARYDSLKNTETQNSMKLAEKYRAEKNMPAYIKALETASDYSPENVKIKVEIADFYVLQQQYQKASHYYEDALEKLPDNEEISIKLAGLYEKTDRFDSAILIYKKIQEMKPTDKTIPLKIEQLKTRFNALKLPEKFKNIFFKENINREEIAALLGHYFDKYLESRQPLIITDIGNSFAREYIIKICSLGIMQLRPDHSFDRFPTLNRAAFAVTFDALLKYLEKSGKGKYSIRFTPLEKTIEPSDISPLHKDYDVIKFLLNSEIMKLDPENNFNPTRDISPSETLVAIQKILNSIRPLASGGREPY
jgi:tetratricopeptide (TPR) repeat protein